MSHKITSNSEVVYNAQNQATSSLTITVNEVNFTDREHFPMGASSHQVHIQAGVWANYSSSQAQRLHGFSYNLPSEDWDTFVGSQTLSSTTPYDQVLESALLYVAENVEPMFGLTGSDWTVSL